MAVATMGRGDPVGATQVCANANAGGFFADVKMQKARGFALAAGNLSDALEAPQQHHFLEKFDQYLPIRQVPRALQRFLGPRRRDSHSVPSDCRAACYRSHRTVRGCVQRRISYTIIMSRGKNERVIETLGGALRRADMQLCVAALVQI